MAMVEIKIAYEGGLHCSAVHGPSGDSLSTDAPVDNNGRGEAYSPTDLAATALGTCMATIIGMVADRKQVSVEGMAVTVRKHMSADLPRRISRLKVDIEVPLPADHSERKLLESSALACPVYQSLHPDIEKVLNWSWQEA
jgi:putative redox protein